MAGSRLEQARGLVVLDEDLQRRLAEALLNPSKPRQMTYEEFLSWADEDTWAEWVDGEVTMTTPASDRHPDISGFLESLLRVFSEVHVLGVVRSAPFQMKLAHSGREPDLLFIAQEHLERLRDAHLDGPADLVVEIISPESRGRDRGEKFYEYEQAAIPEYWLIDPQREQAEFYQLDDEGHYRLTPADAEGIYRSKVLSGLWLRVAWLWELPRVLDVIRELGLV